MSMKYELERIEMHIPSIGHVRWTYILLYPVAMWVCLSFSLGVNTYLSDKAKYTGKSVETILNDISEGRREMPVLQLKVDWYDSDVRLRTIKQIHIIDVPVFRCTDASADLDSTLLEDGDKITKVSASHVSSFFAMPYP